MLYVSFALYRISADKLVKNSEQHAFSALDIGEYYLDRLIVDENDLLTGCSHSNIFAQEVFYRAGGFLLMNPIFLPGMTLETPPATRTSKFERIPGIAEAVLSEAPIRESDVLVIASVSGRNDVPVEMALWARERGVKVVALTSFGNGSEPSSERQS
ncbi:SIS domain-containing protein [Paenibacillus mendelii]|uniref:SIS domain-containing protein n=1 Tax=Paenibacillus mendelii TaxID=206163 RepID=A0ABV6JIT2_9BACL|nr:SIS domain-containing protein [Paenibacillus mendelii]MCQ6557342.1 SIS domain-containing protein [Paenibacillus mendelii]